ncbi:Replication initiator protein A [Allochromatium palmeri]|uniref:Replication initiator protein A n=2 Tax=Allochromatium palmeri TaxID=231048 RepID=A0A6N8EHE3_9GAMM|nr:Replication initiator protein A [Allochromatium palmeri]
MQSTLERLQALSAERAKAREAEKTAKILQMPMPVWPESVRGVPNVALRSALFGAIKRGPRRYMDRELVTSLEGYEVRYTGPRLDQSDLDVWEALLHLARRQALGNRIEASERQLLKEAGRSYGKSGREWLKSVAARLSATTVEIQHDHQNYGGSLVDEFYRDDIAGCYVIELNPRLQLLFAHEDWTQVEWEQRQKLKRQPLAQWLHGFYSTHARPFPLKVKTLHQLSGSEAKQLYHFRAELRDALACLEEATGWTHEIDTNDLVHVGKIPTPSQARYLSKPKQPKK